MVAGALGAVIVLTIGLAISTLTASGIGWLVAKMFGDDYGSAGTLILRYAAVTAASLSVLSLMRVVGGPWMALILAYPVTIAVVMLAAGADLLRAIIFCALLSAVWFTLGFMLLGVLGGMALGAF